jgi:hypothetical protein
VTGASAAASLGVQLEGSSAALKKLFEILEDASQVKQAWNRK